MRDWLALKRATASRRTLRTRSPNAYQNVTTMRPFSRRGRDCGRHAVTPAAVPAKQAAQARKRSRREGRTERDAMAAKRDCRRLNGFGDTIGHTKAHRTAHCDWARPGKCRL